MSYYFDERYKQKRNYYYKNNYYDERIPAWKGYDDDPKSIEYQEYQSYLSWKSQQDYLKEQKRKQIEEQRQALGVPALEQQLQQMQQQIQQLMQQNQNLQQQLKTRDSHNDSQKSS